MKESATGVGGTGGGRGGRGGSRQAPVFDERAESVYLFFDGVDYLSLMHGGVFYTVGVLM